MRVEVWNMRILIIEDDLKTASFVMKGLKQAGSLARLKFDVQC
jgi:DNA-binding response OmpR family regulator